MARVGSLEDEGAPAKARIDVLFLAALQDEIEAVLRLGGEHGGGWREARDRSGFRYHHREVLNERGLALRVAAAWTGQMGETAAATRGQALIDELAPQCVAMCGICAGRRGEVSLGDVIVADRLYSFDHGKLIAAEKDGAIEFFHDIETYNLESVWRMDVSIFARDLSWSAELLKERPVSKASQARWLMHALYAHEAEQGHAPAQHPDRKARCPDWAEVLRRLRKGQLVESKAGALHLTETGRDRVLEERLDNPDGIPDDPAFRVHIGPIATCKAVREDPAIFDRLKRLVRKTLGVEMEAAAIGYVAERLGRRAIVAKAVSDHADGDKDDSFRAFACRASAEFLLAFLRRELDPEVTSPQRPLRTGADVQEITDRFNGRHAVEPLGQRRNAFLGRVETVCRLREPNAQIRRIPASAPFGEHLEVTVRMGRRVLVYPVAALEGAVTEEAVQVYLAEIDAPYRKDTPHIYTTLVHAEATIPEAIERGAAAHGVHLMSFSEYKGLINFTAYVERQTRRLEADPIYPPSLYVEQRALMQFGAEERLEQDAYAALVDLIKAPHPRFVLVLGDFGTGKTFLLHELARRMGAAKDPPVPVLIEIRALEKAADLDALLARHLALTGMKQIDLEAFRYMLAEGEIALLFDGFDELALRVTYDRAAEHFDTLIQAAMGNAKVVITSRTQHFLSDQQVWTALGQRARQIPGYRIVTLQPFEDYQIRHFLAKRLGDDEEATRRMRLLDEVKDLLGLSHNPRMLSFVAELDEAQLLAAKEREGDITAAELYRLLLERWIVFEFNRANPRGAPPGLNEKQRWKAVTALACRLWETTDRAIDIRVLPPEVTDAVRALGPAEIDGSMVVHQIGSGTLLVRDDGGMFSFVHQSVLEWLVARDAANELINTEDGASAPALGRAEMSDLMADFLIDLAGAEIARRWVERTLAAEEEVGRKNALRVLRQLWRRGAGAAAELQLEGADMRGQDFSNVDLHRANLQRADLTNATLKGADLTGARLSSAVLIATDLTGARLGGADFTGANLTGATLLGADLSGANLRGTLLRRAKLVGARGASLSGSDVFGAALPVPQSPIPSWVTGFAFNAVAFSPDGGLLATGHDDGTVHLWDTATGSALRVLNGHSREVMTVAFSPDGHTLASGSVDNAVAIWQVTSGNALRILKGHTNSVMDVAFSPDGHTLASGSVDNTVILWHLPWGNSLCALKGHTNSVVSVAFSPDGHTLASGSHDKTVTLWHVSSGNTIRVIKGHSNLVTSVAFSPDGHTLASGSVDNTITLWHVRSGKVRRILKGHSDWVRSVAFSPDGHTLASGSDDETVTVWDVRSGNSLCTLKGHSDRVMCLAFSPDGHTIASGSNDETVALWHVPSSKTLRVLRGQSKGVMSVAFHPSGDMLASGSEDNTVTLWDIASGKSHSALKSYFQAFMSLAFSPDGQTIASGCYNNSIALWDIASGSPLHALDGHSESVESLSFSPDGQTLASGSHDNTVTLWHVAAGKSLRVLRGHSKGVMSIAFSPDGHTLASGSDDNTVTLWHVDSGKSLRILKGHFNGIMSVVFSPDGQTLASGSDDKTIILWHVASGQSFRVLKGHSHWVRSVAFSPDGRILASGSSDKTVVLWDLASDHSFRVLASHSGKVICLAFSPDGYTLASGSSDGTVRLWSVATGACLAVLLKLPEGWVAFTPDGRYKFGGDVAGGFWHAVNLCRFEPGELDPFVPGLRVPDDEPIIPPHLVPSPP